MVDKLLASKAMSEEEFNAQLRAERAQKAAPHGMVMTHPPSGPSRSLQDVLREHQQDFAAESASDCAAPEPKEINRKYQNIAVSLIDANPLAPREIYTPQMIRERAEALRTQGQHDPIHVIPNPDEPNRFIICDGWTRVQACRDHQVMYELVAEVHEGMSLEESAWFGYQQNEERQQHCDLDRAMFYERLIATGESAAEVSRRAGISKSQMTFYRSYSRLPSEVMDIIRESPDRFGATVAYHLERLCQNVGKRKAVALAARYAEENRPRSWLIAQVQGLIEVPAPRRPSSAKQIRFANGFYKQRDDSFEVNIKVDPAKRDAFAQALEALLATVGEAVAD
ncbi:ParB/RepB/Spo0J family partition protein [Thauera sp.]|uniref:ParB/RepB/Spo0J family partition protein n=1 Tax=Thauera sp. TaxID=1905334 RepID=UPI00257D776A|nr:ParB/RepB/Spo0J family partition protein [Thauera sp.]